MSESYMEKALLKVARQINAFDEASLMSLWEKYAERVRNFEPTKRWEESVLVFNLIQSTRLKNQLFNYNWAQSRAPGDEPSELDLIGLTAPSPSASGQPSAGGADGGLGEESSILEEKKERKGKLLTLNPRKK